MKSKIYYCYSRNLHYFLMALGERYISSSVNKTSNVRYWTFQKSEKLDQKINLYNSVKHKFD